MLRLRQFSPQTKSKSRGSIALLSVVWLAVTVISVGSLTRVTATIHRHAEVQTHADSIALAAADHGDDKALRFARSLHVTVVSIRRTNNTVTIHVAQRELHAIATALHPV